MVFPPDVRGEYIAPERDIAVHQGITELRFVKAEVTRDTIAFTDYSPYLLADIEVYSKNTYSTGYDPLKKEAQKATVRIDGNKNYGHTNAPTPIVFTTTDNKIFEFDYLIPEYDDQPWKFTKTTTPPPDPPPSGGVDSKLIMLAVILMVVAAVGVRM